MSISELGATNRNFMSEIKLWPPARIFASSEVERRDNASGSEDGA
jgi:hypothetical protein